VREKFIFKGFTEVFPSEKKKNAASRSNRRRSQARI
jgi:hypothetical protein